MTAAPLPRERAAGPTPVSPPPPDLATLVGYFAWLGATGFGGPIALVSAMQRDLVEKRRWITAEDYTQGLALAQLAPGPLAAQLAIYLGWVRGRVLGATAVAVAFVLPSFVMVLGLSALYLRFGGLPWMQWAFYGVGPAAIAVIARGAWRLMRTTLGRDADLWLVFAGNALITALTGRELAWVVLASGVAVLTLRRWNARLPGLPLLSVAGGLGGLLIGAHGAATPGVLWDLAVFFAEAGAFVFGSGLAIVPFLHGGVVETHRWLSDRQFLDAVAVAMITPGPVVITVAFIGFLVAGPAGAAISAGAVFLPCYLLVILPAPGFRRVAGLASLRHFVGGVTAAATGAIAGSVIVLGRRSIVDPATVAIGLAALALPLVARRLPDPLIVVSAAIVGILLRLAAA